MLHLLILAASLSQEPILQPSSDFKRQELREELRMVRARLSKAQHGTTIRINRQREKEIELQLTSLGDRDFQNITGRRKR